MLNLNDKEAAFYQRFLQLKSEAGNHSPSIYRLLSEFPEVSIKVDACFLCNPYAFDIFMQKLNEVDLEPYVKFYPPQNEEVAQKISQFCGVPSEQILVGNGAIEIIETLMARFAQKTRTGMVLPTFSTYYEVAEKVSDKNSYFKLASDGDFCFNADDYIEWVKRQNPGVLVLVNPNNPTGTLISKEDVLKIWKSLSKHQILIVDESFIHFAPGEQSIEKDAIGAENLIIIRSLSKDFGIAGLRVGYSVMPKWLREDLLSKGFLWNSNGIAYYFTTLLSDPTFQKQYHKARERYNVDRDKFYEELQKIEQIKVRESSANFFMLETAEDPGVLFSKLLYNYGIYSRILNDKVGLSGNFIRIASKDRRENQKIINALKKIYDQHK
jgi:histidinol-phosphate/aromatic aminotransferase/cobyric acid decarboxylase-like protein